MLQLTYAGLYKTIYYVQASKQGYNLDVGHHKNITISQLNHLSESKYCLGIWKCGKWKWK